MADRMDDQNPSPIGGLSIWVGLATFFSNSSERSRAKEAVIQAKEAEKQKEAAAGETGSVKSKRKGGRRFGSWFGSSSKKGKAGADNGHTDAERGGSAEGSGASTPA